MYKALAATPAPTAGMGMGMGMGTPTRTYLIIIYPKPGERAHLQKLVKRERAIPAICMRWALIEMYLRSQFPIQTDRDVRSYGSESTDLGLGWARWVSSNGCCAHGQRCQKYDSQCPIACT